MRLTDRREQTHYQAIARSQLDAASWDAAWQEGWSNSPAQYMALGQSIRDMPM